MVWRRSTLRSLGTSKEEPYSKRRIPSNVEITPILRLCCTNRSPTSLPLEHSFTTSYPVYAQTAFVPLRSITVPQGHVVTVDQQRSRSLSGTGAKTWGAYLHAFRHRDLLNVFSFHARKPESPPAHHVHNSRVAVLQANG